MADMFQLWKNAKEAKQKARQKKNEAAVAKKKRDDAWQLYTEQYDAYVTYSNLRPEEKERWAAWVNSFRKEYDQAADDWLKAEDDADKAERAAINAVANFNRGLPPDVPPMPMDF